jgi:ribosomal protein S18 acetylase RimI-like enzyme
MALERVFRVSSGAERDDISVEPVVEPAEVAALLDDFQDRLLRLTHSDYRAELARRFEAPDDIKVVWRSPRREVIGAGLLSVEGNAAELVFLHALPRYATVRATGHLLEAVLRALPPGVSKLRAFGSTSGRWVHLPAAKSRALLCEKGFFEFERALLMRDLRRPLPSAPPLPSGYEIAVPDPDDVDRWAAFAFEAYSGTTDFGVITLEESAAAYRALYARFLSGELGTYARRLSFVVQPAGGAPCAVLHTVFVGGEPYIGDLSILPAHRRKGLGRALLVHGLDAFRQAGFSRTGLTATVQNRPAYALYQWAGFEVERSNHVFLHYGQGAVDRVGSP